MIDSRLSLLSLSLACTLAGCGNYLPAQTTFQVVSRVVSSAIVGKVIFDPIWEHFVPNWSFDKLRALQTDFANIAAQRIVEKIVPSAQARGPSFECEPNEHQDQCEARVGSLAEYEFDIYAKDFGSAFTRCRDDVVLGAATGARDYVHQVDLITQCVANAGYHKEVAMIINRVRLAQQS